MDYTIWKFWLDVAQLLAIAAVGFYTWWANRNKATQKRFTGLEKQVGDVEAEVKTLKNTLKNRPPCLHHDEFDTRLRKVQQGVSNIDGRLVGVGNSLDLIQTHLMQNGGKS